MRQAVMVLSFSVLLGCSNAVAPVAKDPVGTWAGNFSVVGSSLVVTLEQADGSITGKGSYAFEAGRPGSVGVSGTYNPPDIALVIRYDFGQTLTYTGTFQDAQHMSGILADSRGHGEPFTFTRR